MASVRVKLFGAPQVELDGEQIATSRRKVVALLAYLACTGRAHNRDELLVLLWPDVDPGSARAYLRRDIWQLKQWLDGTGLEIVGSQVGLDFQAGLWVDVREFRARLEQYQAHAHPADELCPDCLQILTESVDLYQDHFMAGFGLPDSPAFDEWQFFEADSMRQLLAEALQRLIGWHSGQREYERAIAYARRWLAMDNLHEPAQRELMRLYAMAGQQAAALRQYQECVRLLDEELGLEPENETTDLYEAIRTRKFFTEHESPSGSALVTLTTEAGPTAPTGIRHNLPAQVTPTLGREGELEWMLHSLRDDPNCRLLSLTGHGGSGKTRLAIQFGFQLVEDSTQAFPDGVWFVPLAPLSELESLMIAVAQALDYSFLGNVSQHRQQLFDYLTPKRLLLILDNFEHLLETEAQSFVQALLQAAPQVKVLVTSRIRLNIQGEQIYAVSGLQVPPDDLLDEIPRRAAELLAFSAVQLFLQTGKRQQLDFTLTAENQSDIVRICRLVEGVPLGIELAASWLDMLSPAGIADEIERSLDFLEAEWTGLPERQRSLRAVFNGSWQLLDDQERKAMKCLSLFPGSFTIQAAQAVSGSSIKVLHDLMHKSWLKNAPDERYQVHELLRQYAAEQLQADPEERQTVVERYTAYYAGFLEEQPRLMRGPDQVEIYRNLGIEFENIRLAWKLCVDQLWLDKAVDRMLLAIFFYCEARLRAYDLFQFVDTALQVLPAEELQSEEVRWSVILKTARSGFFRNGYPVRFEAFGFFIPGDEDTIRQAWETAQQARIQTDLGVWSIYLAYLYGRIIELITGVKLLRILANQFRQEGQDWTLAFAQYSLGNLIEVILYNEENTPALRQETEQCLMEAVSIYQALGDQRESGNAQRTLGNLYLKSMAYQDALYHWQAARTSMRETGDPALAAGVTWQIGDLYLRMGKFESAFEEYATMSHVYRERGYPQFEAYSLSKESMELTRYGDIDKARDLRERALTISRQTNDIFGVAWASWEMGEIERISGDHSAARTWFETAGRQLEQIGDQSGRIFYQRGLGDLAQAAGDYQRALAHFKESLEWAKNKRHEWGSAYAFSGLGRAELGLEHPEDAKHYFLRALKVANVLDDRGLLSIALCGLAETFAADDPAQAARLAALVASNKLTWNETRAHAQAVLERISELSHQERASILEQSQVFDLAEEARKILVEAPEFEEE